MADDRVGAIEALLTRTEEAHGAYETAELHGVYDVDWARWYATFAVEHGIGDLIGHEVGAERLATFLSEAFAAFERADPPPAVPWSAFIAERLAAEL
jgi:hypothetical protein